MRKPIHFWFLVAVYWMSMDEVYLTNFEMIFDKLNKFIIGGEKILCQKVDSQPVLNDS